MDALLITLQSSAGDFDASYIRELHRFESIMQAKGLDRSSYIICKDRVQFTELPFSFAQAVTGTTTPSSSMVNPSA